MMKKLLFGALAASGLIVFSGCSDTFDPTGDGRLGRILPDVDLNKDVAGPRAKANSRAGGSATEIGVEDLTLTLTGPKTSESFGVADFPVNQDFPVGDYTLEAAYGNEGDEGFGKPWYYGSTALTVLENKTTPVSVTASLANAMVSVQYTEAVKQYFASYEAEVASSTGNSFAYTADETNALYVMPGKVDINVNLTKQNGVSAKLNPYSFTAEARHHYIVTFDVNGGEVGVAQLIVKFDEELATETVELDLSDKILLAPAPTVVADGFTSGEALRFVAGSTPENKHKATVMAQGGLKTVVLTTDSKSLITKGWPATVDFAAATPEQIAKLKELGLKFPGLEGKYDRMAMLDFTDVVSHIDYVTTGSNTSSFTIVAKDNLMKSSDPAVVLSVEIEELAITLGEIDQLYIGDTELAFNIDYNGNPDDLKVELKNDRGTWTETTAEISAISRAATTYHIVATVPGGEAPVAFRVKSGNTVSSIQDIERVEPTHMLDVTGNNVYATHAFVQVKAIDGSDASSQMSSATFFVSADGTTFKEVNAEITNGTYAHISGLTPNAVNYVRAKVNGLQTRAVSFTTEAPVQIPGSDMETWSSRSINSGATKYNIWSLESPWCTLNELTNSSLNAVANYCGGSGTLETTDANNGKAALIRTMGWKRSTIFSDPQNFTAGELYVGTYSGGANYGTSFSTRPSSLSFYYKYTARNSGEQGYAEIAVLDASGNVLATGNKALAPRTNYAKETVSLSGYACNSAKAATIKVIFKSTNTDQYLNKNGVGKEDGESGYYVGSKLYIDDIALEY